MNKSNRIILRLDKKLSDIFDCFESESDKFSLGSILNPFIIKYKFSFEIEFGFIEYKRTLSSYVNKKDKLLRQILWRISESLIFDEITKPTCYYLIGLEDNGNASNLSIGELKNSLKIILDSIINTILKYKFVYLFNQLNKSYVLVIKIWIDEDINNFTPFE
jgi:GTPase